MDVLIISSLVSDIDSISKKFLQDHYDYGFNRFSEIFMEMEFSSIFLGRFSSSDLVEFTENLFIYCSRFMFGPFPNSIDSEGKSQLNNLESDGMSFSRNVDQNYKDRIFGIFLCYSFYFLQPSQYVVPVPVTPSQLSDFYEFLSSVLLPDENFGAIYCFYRLIDANAFSIVPVLGSFNPLLQRTFNIALHHKPSSELGVDNVDDFGLLFSLSNSELLKQSESLHRRYMNLKRQCSLNLPNGTEILSESPMDIMGRLLQESEEIYSRQCTLEEEGKSLIDRRKKIRDSAYSQSGKLRRDRRHRSARE